MDNPKSRRGFIAELLTKVTGGWLAVASLAGLSSWLSSGCSDDSSPAPKYGINLDGRAADQPAPKYGINPDR